MIGTKARTGQEGHYLENGVNYIIEREFLSEISMEELMARIIRSHWDNNAQKWGNLIAYWKVIVFCGL